MPQLRTLPDLAILCTPKGHQTTDVIKWIRIYISLFVTIFSEIFNIDIQNLKRPALILQSIAFSLRAKRGGYWKISQEGFFFPPPLSDENEFGILLLAGWLMIAIKTVNSLVTLKTPYRGAAGPKSWRDGLMSYEGANLGDKYVVRHRPYVKIRQNYYPFLYSSQ